MIQAARSRGVPSDDEEEDGDDVTGCNGRRKGDPETPEEDEEEDVPVDMGRFKGLKIGASCRSKVDTR